MKLIYSLFSKFPGHSDIAGRSAPPSGAAGYCPPARAVLSWTQTKLTLGPGFWGGGVGCCCNQSFYSDTHQNDLDAVLECAKLPSSIRKVDPAPAGIMPERWFWIILTTRQRILCPFWIRTCVLCFQESCLLNSYFSPSYSTYLAL